MGARDKQARINRGRNDRRRAVRESLRDKIDGEKLIDELWSMSKVLEARGVQMSSNEIGVFRVRTEICFKMLAKVLPDLKAVAMSTEPVSHNGIMAVPIVLSEVEYLKRMKVVNDLEA